MIKSLLATHSLNSCLSWCRYIITSAEKSLN